MGPLDHNFEIKNFSHLNKVLLITMASAIVIGSLVIWSSLKIRHQKSVIHHEGSQRMGAEATGLTDAYGKPIDMVADAEKLDAGQDDDMARVKKKIAEEQKRREETKKNSSAHKDDAQFESELEALRKVKDREKAAELAAEKRASAQRRIAKIRQIREGNSEEHKLREKIRREEKIPEISDDEAVWKGFDQ